LSGETAGEPGRSLRASAVTTDEGTQLAVVRHHEDRRSSRRPAARLLKSDLVNDDLIGSAAPRVADHDAVRDCACEGTLGPSVEYEFEVDRDRDRGPQSCG
jgi:hypothetical protein